MSQSLSRLYVHIVFHTGKSRVLIRPEDKIHLCSYTGSILKDNGSTPVSINGTNDHLHIGASCRKMFPWQCQLKKSNDTAADGLIRPILNINHSSCKEERKMKLIMMNDIYLLINLPFQGASGTGRSFYPRRCLGLR